MAITPEDLCGAVQDIGLEQFDGPIRHGVVKALTDLHAIEIQPDGQPTLTTFGWQIYTIIESGDGDVPEFKAYAESTPDA